MEFATAILSGFLLGSLHAFDVDHVTAVAALSSKHSKPMRVAKLGAMWGLGHTMTLLILGSLSFGLKVVIPDSFSSIAEFMIGFLLIGIGIWVIREAVIPKKSHAHEHEHNGSKHSHTHHHNGNEEHNHMHSLFFVGAAHGMAGTAAVLLIVPLTISQSIAVSVLFLLLFGIGTIVSMALFAYGLGRITLLLKSQNGISYFRRLAGGLSIIIGIIWIGNKIL